MFSLKGKGRCETPLFSSGHREGGITVWREKHRSKFSGIYGIQGRFQDADTEYDGFIRRYMSLYDKYVQIMLTFA